MMYVIALTNPDLYVYIAINISFNQSTYSVNEDDGPAQPVLVLSNPSSADITIQVKATNGSATGKCMIIICFKAFVHVYVHRKS